MEVWQRGRWWLEGRRLQQMKLPMNWRWWIDVTVIPGCQGPEYRG